MRVLYAAMYNDPTDPMAASGVDYNFYTQIKNHASEVRIVGPFRMEGFLFERAFKRLYTHISGKRYMKWNFRAIREATKGVNQAASSWPPDVIFSMFPSNLAFYNGNIPTIFVTDLTFKAWQEYEKGFGWMAFIIQHWLEKKAVRRSARVIVHSQWGRDELIRAHSINPDKIKILAMPAALPASVIPDKVLPGVAKRLETPLRLLLVGREYHRKGVDIAQTVARLLNDEHHYPTELIICGTIGPSAPYSKYVGPFDKKDTIELQHYTDLYRQAHILIHPARFEPAGIVPGEAAAFGTPTITNNAGGLGTTVADGVSGIVLPKHSPAEAYVGAIIQLINDPQRYYRLCQTTRERYERELNWEVAGKQVYKILQEVVQENESESIRN